MFDAMIIFCVVHALEGDPVSQCYGMESDQIFKTFEACREWADTEEIQMSARGLRETDKLFVTQIACGEYKG